ncbi:MAG: site-2 protease family protein [Deltaproteobacteria bacterium]|nr:site-2 protease family protein [Deltaproteobacteria bacterium]
MSPFPPPPPKEQPREPASRLKKLLLPLGVVGVVLWKLKVVLVAALKFLPMLLKTGGTMFLSIWLYAMAWGWWFAAGFVALMLVHECGHLVAARRVGLAVSAPMFIPFMGAFIALKDAPPDAWVEAQVGIGGPLLGSAGAAACLGLGFATHTPLLVALAYSGFFLNLFNLVPIGFLDGGRIAAALSPWLWLMGAVVTGILMFLDFNLILLVIFVMALPRLWSLFRRKSPEEERYYEVTPARRLIMGLLYFGLAAALVAGMRIAYVPT